MDCPRAGRAGGAQFRVEQASRPAEPTRTVGGPWHRADMEQRISFVTLAVADLAATRRFYLDGLGWTAELDVPGEVLMIRTGERLVLSLWAREEFEKEVGAIGTRVGVPPITLAHNVPTTAEVDAVLRTARAAGADPVHDAVERDWGGYTGYFADPDSYRWEVAYNPGPIGQLVLP
nr:VOC family protein [Pseudofrankia sp. EUN1h]